MSRVLTVLAAFSLLPSGPYSSRFLEDEVHFLISSRERAEIDGLESEEARERFIGLFWARRDPDPATPQNQAREEHERRLAESDVLFREGARRGRHSDRGRVHQLLGAPRFRESFDAPPLVPLELWHYAGVESPFLPESFYLVFFRPPGNTRYRLYRPTLDEVAELLQEGQPGRFLLQSGLPDVARVDLELAAAIESLTPGGASESARLLFSLDALPDLLDRGRRETASVRSEASFGRIEARLEAVLLYDDAEIPEIHYALELAPGAARALLASPRKRFTLQGAVHGGPGELDRWEDQLALEGDPATLEPRALSFQGRRLAPPLAERVEVVLVDERGESASASADLSRFFLSRVVRVLDELDPDLPFRVGDRLLSPIAGGVVAGSRAFAVAQLSSLEGEIVWELFEGENRPPPPSYGEPGRSLSEGRLWQDRGPWVEAPLENVVKELPLSTLESGPYRLWLRVATTSFARDFEWRSGGPDGVRVLARERAPREEASYRRARASSFARRGDRTRAIEELARAALALPGDVRLQLELASFRYAAGEHADVLEQLSSVRSAFPGEVDLLVLLGASLEALGRIDEAAAVYGEAAAAAPENESLREAHERLREKLTLPKPRRDR